LNEPLFTPSATSSALYSALCNADATTGTCQFQSVVTLDSNLECDGDECNLGTLRVIKIAGLAGHSPVFYEYVQVPCVSLAFFVGAEGGRYIENVNHFPSHDNEDELIERVCADPEAMVAAPGCCSEQRHVCFEYRCAYVEERVTLSTALERCSSEGLDATADPPPMPEGDLARWSLYPHEYRLEHTACPVGSGGTADESSCLEAATAALAAAGEPHFHTPRNYAAGSWGDKPSGCIVDTSHGDVKFNRHEDGSGNDEVKLVCSDVPEELRSDYHDASELLCSRKRRHCWWSNEASNCASGFNYGKDLTSNLYWWTEEPCSLQAQVNIDGRVSIVHPGSESIRRVGVNSGSWFRVHWEQDQFPSAPGCGGDESICSVVLGESGDTCLCDIDMATSAVYDDASQVPELVSEVQEALRIGSPSPDHFGSGTYAMCDTAACQARAPLVKVYTRGTADSPLFDETAIFEIFDALRVRSVYLTNKQSVVTIASGHSFRNPPQFNRLVDASQRDALYETEALLDHLFSHQNTAPFAAKVLIKSLVTSNPSPRYIQAVATAFKSGAYIGRAFSGRYGDIGAAVAAVLLDREARSLVLPADTTYGKIREPLLRLVHLMRAMEYTPRDNREVALSKSLSLQIGQAVYKSPTVFSFFRPDFAAEGAVEASQLVSPEAQLGVLPNVIGMLDGVSSLVFEGLNSCSGGFGTVCERNFVTPVPSRTQLGNTGYLSFVPTDFSSAESVLHELDLLLTGGRLDPHSYAVITEEYDRALTASSCPVDRTAELCGHLVPGDVLQRGEQITNADGEVLCVSYDGVAHHIGVDGREVFSTAYSTRGYESDGLHYESGGELRMEGPVHWGVSNNKWKSDSHDEDSTPAAFHTFLAGPCMLLDTDALGRLKMHGYTSFGGQATEITCEAPSTCGVPTIEYMGCYNDNTNGVRDMIQNSFITGSNDFEVVSRECGLEACRGFSYFGLQWDNECWCGNDYGSQGENSDCGDASSTSNGICADGTGRNACGGRNAVYSLTPPPPPPPPTRSAEYLAERAKTDAMLALQVAQTLVAATPAFAVTNDPATSDVSAPEVAPRTRRDNDYKALVVMYMNGGADTQNLIVPHSNCDERNGVEQYLTTRSDAALDLDQVLQIEVAPGTQLCDTMGLHPRFDTLEQLYNDGDAAFIANIGALVEPVTQEQVLNRELVVLEEPALVNAIDSILRILLKKTYKKTRILKSSALTCHQ